MYKIQKNIEKLYKNQSNGFTLIETILVIAIIIILAAVVLVTIKPFKNIAESRNSQRETDVKTILDAVNQYSLDNNGMVPAGIDNKWSQIGNCTNCEITCGEGGTSGTNVNINDVTVNDFNTGGYLNTQYNNAISAIDLNSAGKSAGSGSYTSGIKDGITNTRWDTLQLAPTAPYGKQLPDNQQTETGYVAGNANMSGNVLLMHLNEQNGAIQDNSGLGNNGVGNNIAYNNPGKFNSSIGFNGSSSAINVPNSSSLNPTNAITMEAWVKWNVNPSTGQPWANIINKNGDDGYQIQHTSTNSFFETAIKTNVKRTYIQSTTQAVAGNWYHVVGTWDNTSNLLKLYVNGNLERTGSLTGSIISSAQNVGIGKRSWNDRYFNGSIDEAAIYNRSLSPNEIKDHYLRGALKLGIKVRSCALADCSGSDFIGPNGNNSEYSESSNTSLSPSSYTLQNIANNRYFQYKVDLQNSQTSFSPSFANVNINATKLGETTNPNGVNLASFLVPTYLASIPYDPVTGNQTTTSYAIKKSSNGRISVKSCSAELGKDIQKSL